MAGDEKATETEALVAGIQWLGHASFRIEADDGVVYIDPWKLQDGPAADVILITHDHGDHCSPADVEKLRNEGTVVVTIAASAAKLPGPVEVVAPGDEVSVRGMQIAAVPAYNTTKFREPGVPFHPKESGHVGFVITLGSRRVYHAGDTDHIPEMEDIRADVALLPVSGTYVMTAEEAAEAAARLGPAVAVPMHVGRGIGSLADADRFRVLATVPVVVLPWKE